MPLYRFYALKADLHVAVRREADCANDAQAVATAPDVAKAWQEYPAIEIWTQTRRVVTLSRDDLLAERARPAETLSARMLISRNKRLLRQAEQACRRTEALCAQPKSPHWSGWATVTWQHLGRTRPT